MTDGDIAPSGTLTFLFTDVVDSTRLWQDHPREMGVALARHDQILRESIEANDGYVFSTAGDAFAAAFTSPSAALQAAAMAQRALGAERWGVAEIRVRMGLHSGMAEERDGDYFGPVLNRAARIMSLAGGSQVLTSSATRGLVGDVDFDVEWLDLGEQQLKSLRRPEHLYQLVGPGLSSEPVTFGKQAVVGNLPAGVADFVGRAGDVEQLRGRVTPGRVVTLTGIGGTGKTQLATRLASALGAGYADGIWWCDLTPVAAPSLVPSTVASAVGAVLPAGIAPIDAVVEVLGRRHLLLLVDNCEHLIEAVAELLEAVMSGCPNLAVITTSREPIGLRDELVFPVPALAPDSDAVDLLLRRAVAADANLDPSVWARSELVELCEHLDGIPLAIEMAAARLRTMAPRQLIDRLEDRFRLLRSKRRDGADHHRTLLAMLDWSYRLLAPDEQLLLDRLAVFADSFDVETAEAVCADHDTDGGLDPFDIDDLLVSLVDKSLVTTVRSSTRTRYRLLETIRHYGLTHLDERDETDLLRRRHATAHLTLAQAAGQRFLDQRFWSGKAGFDDCWPDIVAALSWAVQSRDGVLVAGILQAAGLSYAIGFGKSEFGALARAALEAMEPSPVAYALAAFFEDGSEQIAAAEAGLSLHGVAGYVEEILYSQLAAGRATTGAPGTLDAIRGAARAARAGGLPTNVAYWEAILAESLVGWGADDASRHAQKAWDALDGWQDHPVASAALGRLAGYEALQGHFGPALELCEEATNLASDAGLLVYRAYTVALSARIGAALDANDAAMLLRDAIAEARESRWWFNVWPVMSAAGRWFEFNGRLEPAAAIQGQFERRGRTRRSYDLVTPPEADLSKEVAHLALGAKLSPDELVDYVLDELAAS